MKDLVEFELEKTKTTEDLNKKHDKGLSFKTRAGLDVALNIHYDDTLNVNFRCSAKSKLKWRRNWEPNEHWRFFLNDIVIYVSNVWNDVLGFFGITKLIPKVCG